MPDLGDPSVHVRFLIIIEFLTRWLPSRVQMTRVSLNAKSRYELPSSFIDWDKVNSDTIEQIKHCSSARLLNVVVESLVTFWLLTVQIWSALSIPFQELSTLWVVLNFHEMITNLLNCWFTLQKDLWCRLWQLLEKSNVLERPQSHINAGVFLLDV